MSKKSPLNIPGIYLVTNSVTGTVYVGQAVNIRKRWEVHRATLRNGTHSNLYLSRAYTKYGSDAFVYSVFTDLSAIPYDELFDALNAAEIDTLEQFPDNYNLMLAGITSGPASDRTREVWSEQRKAMWSDPDFRAKRIAATKALYADPQWKKAHSEAVRAGKRDPEARQRASRNFVKLWENPKHRAEQAARRKANWKDPEYRARVMASRAATWTPEKLKARGDAIRAAKAKKTVSSHPAS